MRGMGTAAQSAPQFYTKQRDQPWPPVTDAAPAEDSMLVPIQRIPAHPA